MRQDLFWFGVIFYLVNTNEFSCRSILVATREQKEFLHQFCEAEEL